MLDGVDGDANPERLGDPQEVIRGARAERLTYPLLVNRPVGPSGDSPATGTFFRDAERNGQDQSPREGRPHSLMIPAKMLGRRASSFRFCRGDG
jgi:hypothetical protein